MPLKPVPPGHLLHITKFGCQYQVQPWLPLEHSFCVLTLWKHFPVLNDAGLESLLISQLQLTSINCPSKAKASLQG